MIPDTLTQPQPDTETEPAPGDEPTRSAGWLEVLDRRRQAAAQPQQPDQPSAETPTAGAPSGETAPTHADVAQMVRDEVSKGLEAFSDEIRRLLSSQQPTAAQQAAEPPLAGS